MRKVDIIFFVFVSIAHPSLAQSEKFGKDEIPQKKQVLVSGGVSYGDDFTNLNISYLQDTHTNAYDARLYFASGIYRFGFNMQHVLPCDLKPGWLNVQANYYDIFFQMKGKGIPLYSIIGLAYEYSSGFYTGGASVPGFEPYINKLVKKEFWGTTLGMGIEFPIYEKIKIFGEVRARFMISDRNKLSWNDQLLTCGIKIDLFSFSLPKISSKHGKPKHFFRMPGDKYHWF